MLTSLPLIRTFCIFVLFYLIRPAVSPFFLLSISSSRPFFFIIYLRTVLTLYVKLMPPHFEFPLFFIFIKYENCNKLLYEYLYGGTIASDNINLKSIMLTFTPLICQARTAAGLDFPDVQFAVT
jgi:hypothetical protein